MHDILLQLDPPPQSINFRVGVHISGQSVARRRYGRQAPCEGGSTLQGVIVVEKIAALTPSQGKLVQEFEVAVYSVQHFHQGRIGFAELAAGGS